MENEAAAAAARSCPWPDKCVLALGAANVDYVAAVEAYPRPDDKTRTTSLSILGGGNAGNTLTALRRLGVRRACIACKLGDDAHGEQIVSEFQREGVGTQRVLRKRDMPSPLTYVIVDAETQTRTCIHTPAGEEVLPEEVHASWLDGVHLLHLDSRSTRAAIALARMANARGIPVVLDIERERAHVRELLPLADYIVTNARYPETFSERLSRLNGMMALLECGRARLVISTGGAEGSVMVRDVPPATARKTTVHGLPVMVTHSTAPPPSECRGCEPKYDVVLCPAWPVEQLQVFGSDDTAGGGGAGRASVVDTTGAGDAFIGGVIFGVLHGYAPEKLMALASYVAARKLTGVGARSALPRWHQMPNVLLPCYEPANKSA